MSSVISAIIAIVVAVFTLIQLGSIDSSYEGHECEASQVYRWSDRACYTPQGE